MDGDPGMTVKELIEELSKYNGNNEVMVLASSSGYHEFNEPSYVYDIESINYSAQKTEMRKEIKCVNIKIYN